MNEGDATSRQSDRHRSLALYRTSGFREACAHRLTTLPLNLSVNCRVVRWSRSSCLSEVLLASCNVKCDAHYRDQDSLRRYLYRSQGLLTLCLPSLFHHCLCPLCVCVCVFFSGIMGQFLGASETIVRATAKCGLKLDSTGLTRASQSPSTDIDRHWREKEHTCMSVVFIRSAAHLLSHTLIFSGIAPLQPGNHICKIR